jgi:hypothetical protein
LAQECIYSDAAIEHAVVEFEMTMAFGTAYERGHALGNLGANVVMGVAMGGGMSSARIAVEALAIGITEAGTAEGLGIAINQGLREAPALAAEIALTEKLVEPAWRVGLRTKEPIKRYVATFRELVGNEVGAIGDIEAIAERAALATKGEPNIVENFLGQVSRESVAARIEETARNISTKTLGNGTKIVEESLFRPYKGASKLGHAFQNHADRNPGLWGKVTGKADSWLEQGINHYKEILDAPGDIQLIKRTRIEKNTGNTIETSFYEKRLPDGRGVRFRQDGTFETFWTKCIWKKLSFGKR